MKKLLCLMALLMLPVLALADTAATATDLATGTDMTVQADVPIYRAKMAKESKMREKPDSSSRYLGTVPDNAEIVIYEWGEKWSLCGYGEKKGYLLTDRFYELWRLGDEPLPGMLYMGGVATIQQTTHVENPDKSSGDLFTGLDLQPGDVIAAVAADGRIPFRRTVLTLPADAYAFTPFAAVEDAQPGDLLYAFTTYYNDGVGGSLAAERRYNIELAVERLNGTVLQPGEQFSFNGICGPYERSNGYVNAPNISKSGYGVGGGVCQVSTTIFEAVLGLELQLDQWEVHQTTGVKYAPVNFDAAVGSRKDLKFTNTLPYAVRLEVMTQRGALTAFFYRAQ